MLTVIIILLSIVIALQLEFHLQEKKLMTTNATALADLQNQVAAIILGLGTIQTSIQALSDEDTTLNNAITALEAQLGTPNGVDPAAIEAVVEQLKTATANIATANQNIQAVTSSMSTEVTTITPAAPAPASPAATKASGA